MNTSFRRHFVSVLIFGILIVVASCSQTQAPVSTSAYDFQIKDLHGDVLDLSEFKGEKVSLFVNTATECGLTPQFVKLQALYDTYRDQGLEIVGFPSNSFNQEPKTEEEILTFCTDNFLIDFPMTKKIEVKGPEQHELYTYLTSAEVDPNDMGEITWNFEKFLVDRDGNVIGRFQPEIEPDDPLLTEAIRNALSQAAGQGA